MGLERLHRLDAQARSPAEALDAAAPEREVPCQRTRVEQLLEQLELLGQPTLLRHERSSMVPGRRTLAGALPAARLGFEDFRVLGLRELLQRLAPDPELRREVLAAADRTVVRRAVGSEPLPLRAPAPNGQAMWRAAERHAVTLYRHAIDTGKVDEDEPAIGAALEQR